MPNRESDDVPGGRQAFNWRRYLRFWGTHVEADVGDELRLHFEMLVERHRAAGMNESEAEAAAKARLGDLPRHTDACVTIATRVERRAMRSLVLDALWWDIRYAARTLLLRNKTWTAVAVLTLALGIGATTAVFSVVNSLILNQVHYRDAGRLALVWRHQDGSDFSMYPEPPIVTAWRSAAHALDGIESYSTTSASLVTDADSVDMQIARVGAGFMRFAGIPPIAGRNFDTSETVVGGPRVAILAERTWHRMFGASRDIVGRQIMLGGVRLTVIGVASDRLRLPAISQARTGVWLPLVSATEGRSSAVIVRLRRGQSIDAAQRELDSIGARIRPASMDGPRFHYMLQRLSDSIGVRDTIQLVAIAVALLLLIACTNVAHLMLARGAARRRELAIRTAVGASRGRLARQLITESVLLSLIGGSLGIALAVAGVRWLSAARPTSLVQLDRAQIDATVLLAAAGLTIVVGVLFGLVAAVRAARMGAAGGLASMTPSGAPRDARVRALLVVSEMALSSAMLVGAVLVVRSVVNLQHVDPGFDAKHLYAIAPTLPRAAYATDKAVAGVISELADRARQLPGVAGVTVAGAMPPDIGMMVSSLEIETPRGPEANAGSSFMPTLVVADDFFATLGIRFREGGTFTSHAGDRNEAIIDEALARRLWPNRRAVGQRFRFASSDPKDQNPWTTVIGVTNDIIVHGLSNVGKEGLVYYPNPGWARQIVVRTNDPDAVLHELRGTAARIDATITKLALMNVEEEVSRTIARQRFSTSLLTGFAVLAVMLAAIGLYGVLAHSVAERTREIGVRIALGATPARIATTVARGGLVLAVVGLALGLVAASWGTRLLRTALFAVGEHDATSFAVASVLLLVVSVVACAIPMRRAMSVDPVIAMRDGADNRW